MKKKYATLFPALCAGILALASTPSRGQDPASGFDGKPIDLTVVNSPSPLVRFSQTQNVPAKGKIQVTCHAVYAPGETTQLELVRYFALYAAEQSGERGVTRLALVSYLKVEPGNTFEFSPPVPTKIVIFGAAEPFLNRPLDNDTGKLPPVPPVEGAPAPTPRKKEVPAPKGQVT